ncbi:polysaccharide biosynthesis family protein [Altererythrobacter sp. B11]|uniref:lipopolysaccharide biosynthesis protein n=1 Tax=Altererythrobacter sp. B11 TaxID=2060312 RepID=UPI000DC731DA|nr:lipopolysaccharide biosynthesis protein [Altererythrobacter sp. B11]BBC72987.1 polysaccharide biosynthesis family protein [Altererythrobacter sp. B11]
MSSTPASGKRKGLPNILGNIAWLVGGKGFGAICSLVYLALLSQSLGIRDFGHFSLIFGTGQALVAIAGFQTWQTMVRFGAQAIHQQDWGRFGRLAWLCGGLEAAGAIFGCLAAYVIYFGFADRLGLNPAYVHMAFAFNCALVWARVTTPNGIVRVLDRFDVSIYVEAVVPAGRVLAAIAIVVMGASVGRFLFAWAAIDLLAAALYWIAAWRLAPHALARRHIGGIRTALRENPGAARFFGITYLSSTLDALFKQGPLLAVGYFLGTSTAGIYRLADQLAQGFGKLSALLGRAIYPEITLARISNDAGDFRRLVLQITGIAGIGGLIVTLVALFFGGDVLGLIGGEAYARGGVILLPLVIGAAFELASVSYEPVLHSTGHAAYPLIARVIAVLTLGVGIFAFVSAGPVGIGWAVALGMAAGYLAMSVIVWIVLHWDRKRA